MVVEAAVVADAAVGVEVVEEDRFRALRAIVLLR